MHGCALIAQKPGDVPIFDNVRYTENTVEIKLGEGIWKTALKMTPCCMGSVHGLLWNDTGSRSLHASNTARNMLSGWDQYFPIPKTGSGFEYETLKP